MSHLATCQDVSKAQQFTFVGFKLVNIFYFGFIMNVAFQTVTNVAGRKWHD